MSVFEAALAYCLVNEGMTFVNLPTDHGGPTRYGITQVTLAHWRNAPVTAADVQALTVTEAGQIYRARYWDAVHGDALGASGVATAVFDAAVVCGPGTAVRLAQAVAGVTCDGHIGPVTLAALQKMPPRSFLLGYMDQMTEHFLRASQGPGQGMFLAGWLKRANRIASLIV